MNNPLPWILCSVVWTALSISSSLAEPPVSFPKLEHYAALWERSVFTTKDLPSPDAPAGPLFTDQLGLAGTYEIDGQFVAILVDRTTSQFTEARIGSENEQGIKIRKVQPGATPDQVRVQLQKGDIAGWVSQAEVETAQPAPAVQVRLAQPAHAPSATPLLPAPPVAPVAPVQEVSRGQDVPLPPP